MQKEEKTTEQINAEAKVVKIHALLKELQMTLKPVLISNEHSLSASIIFVDNEKYPEEPKIEEPKVEESTEAVTA